MKRWMWMLVAGCAALTACGEVESAEGESDRGAVSSGAEAVSTPAGEFSATLTGAVDARVSGDRPLAGEAYGRYHVQLPVAEQADGTPRVLISFGRKGDEPFEIGSHDLGSGSDIYGSVEVGIDPQREFSISSGTLEITAANGNALTGRFHFTAGELTDAPTELRGEGTFRTAP